MPVSQQSKVGEVSGSATKILYIPKAFADGNGLIKGQRVELVLGDVLVLIPKRSAQGDRIRRAMAEEEG